MLARIGEVFGVVGASVIAAGGGDVVLAVLGALVVVVAVAAISVVVGDCSAASVAVDCICVAALCPARVSSLSALAFFGACGPAVSVGLVARPLA